MLIITILILTIEMSSAFWPPAYKIHLNQSETFVISDMFDEYDAEDFSIEDEEMIKRADVERFLGLHSPKFYRIHNIAGRRNRAVENLTFKEEKPTEMPYDKQDSPEYAGFVNNKSELETNENVYYANEMAKAAVEQKIKELRKEKNMLKQDNDEDYDFGSYKKEYADLVKKEEKSKKVLKYTEIPEEESAKDSFKNIVTFRNITNCTAEEMKGIGLYFHYPQYSRKENKGAALDLYFERYPGRRQPEKEIFQRLYHNLSDCGSFGKPRGFSSIKCFYHDLSHPNKVKNKEQLMKRFFKFVIIWFLVYIAIAIPCWCTRGWCCCCLQCKFCKPQQRIDEVKKFVANNPLGVLQLDERVVTYEPTIYEEHAQKRLEQALMKL